jgi:hypothetical protein
MFLVAFKIVTFLVIAVGYFFIAFPNILIYATIKVNSFQCSYKKTLLKFFFYFMSILSIGMLVGACICVF